ncbi:UNVERIFIED_CONTAM: hypothetical protein FKN15_072130 [Acipenser sinensis]
MKCPTPGCNSLGHLTGKHERHFSISGCPLYHNLSADECKVRANNRDKQVEERTLSHRQDENNRHATRHQEHRQTHGNTREPLLENITSDYDLELFRKAQARASDDLVREKIHALQFISVF